MKTRDTTALKQQLLQQRESLLQQLAQLRGGASIVDAPAEILAQSETSHAQVFSERELELILDDRESGELRTINAALQRMEEGVYGLCTDCGVEIPLARLQAAPEAARCISCQNKHEHARQGAVEI